MILLVLKLKVYTLLTFCELCFVSSIMKWEVNSLEDKTYWNQNPAYDLYFKFPLCVYRKKRLTKKEPGRGERGKVSALQQETFQSAFNHNRPLLQRHSRQRGGQQQNKVLPSLLSANKSTTNIRIYLQQAIWWAGSAQKTPK